MLPGCKHECPVDLLTIFHLFHRTITALVQDYSYNILILIGCNTILFHHYKYKSHRTKAITLWLQAPHHSIVPHHFYSSTYFPIPSAYFIVLYPRCNVIVNYVLKKLLYSSITTSTHCNQAPLKPQCQCASFMTSKLNLKNLTSP